MTKTLKGIAASDGIAIAPAYLLVEPDLSFSKSSIADVEAGNIPTDFNLSSDNN